MINVLFIGNLLSGTRGTKGITETVVTKFPSHIKCKLASRKENKLVRMFEIILYVLFSNYSIIYIEVFSGQGFRIAEVASMLSKLRSKLIILSLHGGKLPDFYKNENRRINKVFKRATLVNTPSLYLKSFFDNKGFSVSYLPNFIDLKLFPYNRKDIKKYSILWVRAFSDIYNPEIAIKTLNEVRKSYPEATLTMVGPDKGLQYKTEQLIADLNLVGVVNIVGPVPNNLLYKYYQSHEVFLNTTSYESFGLAVVEAASCGIPIVSTKVGEIPFLWEHEENILLVDKISSDDFSKEVTKLFKNEFLIEKLSKAAKRNIERFDWNNIKHLWVDMLNVKGAS